MIRTGPAFQKRDSQDVLDMPIEIRLVRQRVVDILRRQERYHIEHVGYTPTCGLIGSYDAVIAVGEIGIADSWTTEVVHHGVSEPHIDGQVKRGKGSHCTA